jgi:hypothetical protein
MNPNSRIWIYQSSREFNPSEVDEITAKSKEFIRSWNSHGSMLSSAIEVKYNRFIVVAVDESVAAASGCSIDKSVSFIRSIESDFNINMFDRMQIAYKDSTDSIKTLSLSDFEQSLTNGQLSDDTIVFNNLITTVEQLQNQWEVPLKDSWHSRLLPA